MSKLRPVRPTRRQKAIISGMRLNADHYLVREELDEAIILYNKFTKKTITRYKKG